MTPTEARSLGRAIRTVRLEAGLTQLRLALAVGVSGSHMSMCERGQVPAARGRPAHPPTMNREQFAAIADALGCTAAYIADRAALSATTRVSLGLQPLGPSRTLVAGIAYDLTDAEADRAADFISGLIAARDLH